MPGDDPVLAMAEQAGLPEMDRKVFDWPSANLGRACLLFDIRQRGGKPAEAGADAHDIEILVALHPPSPYS